MAGGDAIPHVLACLPYGGDGRQLWQDDAVRVVVKEQVEVPEGAQEEDRDQVLDGVAAQALGAAEEAREENVSVRSVARGLRTSQELPVMNRNAQSAVRR